MQNCDGSSSEKDWELSLNSYSMRHTVTAIRELGKMIKEGEKVETAGKEKEKEILEYLAASAKILIEGMDEGFVNNIRGLQQMRFLDEKEAELAIGMHDGPDPAVDFDGLIKLVGVFSTRLPMFKENLTC